MERAAADLHICEDGPVSLSPDEPAHDVLAAEAFAMPGPDPSLHHGPLILPQDPTGTEEPHDVLAAEEFPMPAMPPHPDQTAPRPSHRIGMVAGLVLAVMTVRALRRRRRRKRHG